ncbi:MAG TPA: PBP1A family penicillin-binding protein [Deltaproteobacteria bacterium]|nr:PBP1A family penicillin-binding protein [Deltaproteobacteria bacterium]
MRWLKFMLLVCFVAIIFAGVWTYLLVFKGLPSVQELRGDDTTKLSKVTAADGTPIAYFPPEGRIVMNGHNVPLTLKQAIISAEDSTFYDHVGLEPRRILSALIADIKANSYVQGASTITQQVVRSYLLTREKTVTRKLREIILALRIEQALTKEQILNLYLDRVYLGSGAYGVQAASIRYFGRECRELELSEMAMLAGLAPAPARYSPLNDFTACKRRQWYVLSRMVNEGYITEVEAKEAYKEPLRIVAKEAALFTDQPYISDYTKALVTERFGEEIFSKGITIRTSIVPELQRAAKLAVRKGVIELEMRQGKYRGPFRGTTQPDGTALPMSVSDKERIFAYQSNQLEWKGYEPYELYWAEVMNLTPLTVKLGTRRIELGPESYAWISPKGKWSPSSHLKPGDLIMLCHTSGGFVISQQPAVQGVLMSFDLDKGGILAMVGGIDYSQSQFNRAISAKRQSGSAIKPFIYAAAIDKGMTPASIIFDAPVTYKAGADEETWQPKNYENRFYGATSLRTGLVLSRNVVTIKVLSEIGLDYTLTYLRRFGMQANLPRDLSLALGSGDMSPYNLFKGYAVFATYGQKFEPHMIESVVQSGRGTIFRAPPPIPDPTIPEGLLPAQDSRVIPAQTAFIITDILKDVVQEGTGWRAKALMRPVAGKTGTSDDNRDTWFVGYSPDVLCGVWVGYDSMTSLGDGETGGKTACPIFVDFMTTALRDRPVRDFKVPEGVVFAKINAQTGQASAEDSPETRFEVFKEGSVPAPGKNENDDQLLKEVF